QGLNEKELLLFCNIHDDLSRKIRYRLYDICCLHGYVELLRVLTETTAIKKKLPKNFIRIATRVGHLHLVKFLIEKFHLNTKNIRNMIFQLASGNGHVEIVKYFKDSGTPTDAFQMAVKYGHLELTKYLCEHYALLNNFKEKHTRKVYLCALKCSCEN